MDLANSCPSKILFIKRSVDPYMHFIVWLDSVNKRSKGGLDWSNNKKTFLLRVIFVVDLSVLPQCKESNRRDSKFSYQFYFKVRVNFCWCLPATDFE